MADEQRPGVLLGGPNPKKLRSRRRMTALRRAVHAVAAPVIIVVIRLLWASYRFRVVGDDRARQLVADGTPLILTFWHAGIFTVIWYLQRLSRAGALVTYLVSPSVDGELAVRMLSRIGARSVRGSATRSGVKAMRELYRSIARENGSPVVLPDGPQGPRHHCKPGSLLLAGLSGAPIQPIGCAARWAWQLPTWDRLLLPLPFSRVVITFGEPYRIPRGLDEDELEARRVELEQALLELDHAAATAAGRG